MNEESGGSNPLSHPKMIKKYMNKEQLVTENLFYRLLPSPTFSWDRESSLTIGKKISMESRLEAKADIEEIKRNQSLSPSSAINKITPRALSWQYTKFLDHI